MGTSREPLAVAHAHTGAVIVTAPAHLDPSTLLETALVSEWPADETTLVYPDGVNWKIAELLDRVIAPARYAPQTHRNLIVTDAHQATATAHDKLLKSLEEPFTATTFWLCHPQSAQLPTTLRGRALATVHLTGPTRAEAVDELVAGGAAPDRAAHLLDLGGGDLHLAQATLRYDLDDTLAAYRASPFTTTPHLTAGRVLLAAAHLGVALGHKSSKTPVTPRGKGTLDTADMSRLNPEQRARTRRLVTRLLSDWENQLLRSVAQIDTPTDMAATERALTGLVAARSALVYNTPLSTIVTRALVTMPS